MELEEKRALLKKMLREARETPRGDHGENSVIVPGFLESREYEAFRKQKGATAEWGAGDLYFRETEGISNHRVSVGGRELINFSSYNYLNLSGHPDVLRAAKDAVDSLGTSVSASRIASGEKEIHRALELSISKFLGTEDAVAMVGGFATNESTIGHLMSERDVILYDSYSHESIQRGGRLSGATMRAFPHNRWDALETMLSESRHLHEKALIVIEGAYSMDGDLPNLPEFVRLKKQFQAALMVDEAHSLGVLGETGRGIGEHFGVDRDDVDIWMGTLSKSLASCGGYLSGKAVLIEFLKYTVPGFVFSVGLPPASAAAAIESLNIIIREPERVSRLQQNSNYLRNAFRERGWNAGRSEESAVIPLIIGNSANCIRMARELFLRGIFVIPIIHPAVPEDAARLRFFTSCDHSHSDLETTVKAIESSFSELGF